MTKALLVIDIQNDYFPDGSYPLWNTEETLGNIENLMASAKGNACKIIHIQHIVASDAGPAPFFNEGSEGVKIHDRILAAAPDAPVVVKTFADAFWQTDLEDVLTSMGVTEILVCGMMTQNCVTHTAISKTAEKYKVQVVADCCTTVDAMIHGIALKGVSNRVDLIKAEDVFV
ncbi:MAG: cysteine hydrolase [Desulfotalea sp.]